MTMMMMITHVSYFMILFLSSFFHTLFSGGFICILFYKYTRIHLPTLQLFLVKLSHKKICSFLLFFLILVVVYFFCYQKFFSYTLFSFKKYTKITFLPKTFFFCFFLFHTQNLTSRV